MRSPSSHAPHYVVEAAPPPAADILAPQDRSTVFSRSLLVLVIVFSVALPRAGGIIPGLRLPLPFGLVLLHLVFWPLILFRYRSLQRKTGSLLMLFGLNIAAVMLAAGIGALRGASFKIILIEVATLLGQVPAFFVVVSLVRSERDSRLAFKWLAMSIIFASVYGIAQYYMGASILIRGLTYTAGSEFSAVNLTYGAESKVLSSYGDPNVFAATIVLFSPALLGYWLANRALRSRMLNVLALLAAGSGILALVYCNSRAGYIGVGLALVVLSLRYPSRAIHVGILLALGLWGLSEAGLTGRMAGRLTISSDDPRMAYASIGASIAAQHPEGAGLGVHIARDDFSRKTSLTPATSVWQTYNSFYLHLLSRAGVFGLATFLWLFAASYFRTWRLSGRREVAAGWRIPASGFLAGAFGVQIALAANPIYQLPGGGINFWLALGLAFSISRIGLAEGLARSASDAAEGDGQTGASAGGAPQVGAVRLATRYRRRD